MSPPIYKLVKLSEGLFEVEEATFKVQGIIIEKDLPPIHSSRYDKKFICILKINKYDNDTASVVKTETQTDTRHTLSNMSP